MTRLLQRGRLCGEGKTEGGGRDTEYPNRKKGCGEIVLAPSSRPMPGQAVCKSQQHWAGCSASSLEPEHRGGDCPIQPL